MCGIWALLSILKLEKLDTYFRSFMKIKHRGPDNSLFQLVGDNLLLGFHRLSIMDLTANGNQPFHLVRDDGSCIYCICNGEIYNYKYLIEKYDLKTNSNSDCSVILPLYEKVGIKKLVELLDGEFAFVIVKLDKNGKTKMVVGRDPIGVRPIFFGKDDDKTIAICSEAKGLCDIYDNVQVFKPGHYMIYQDNHMEFIEYYSYIYQMIRPVPHIEQIFEEIRRRFTNAVKKRLQSDADIGFLLSGGLDSSLTTAVAKKLMGNKKFKVFTIGFREGSTDLPYAKKVAEYLDLEHHIITVDYDDALKEIDETIYAIESYDITSVRASVMQKLASKWIRNNTNIKVLLCGDNSDECCQSYKYFHNAPNAQELHQDGVRLVKEVHMYDGLRSDRTCAYHGIEIRLPFADPEFVDYYLSIDPELRKPKNGMEKELLRYAFLDDTKLLPIDILMRSKEAMSDGVSTSAKSWFVVIQDYIDKLITDEEFLSNKDKYFHCKPFTKESYYYRKKFCEFFGDIHSNLIPHFWMPKWTPETNDPSARTLKVYKK